MEFITNHPAWSTIFVIFFLLLIVGIRDVLQKKKTIQHNFPVVGHLRYMLETIGPELRQYIVANNREELPFNRRHRSWIYASAKVENNFQGFGSDQDMNSAGYIFIKHAMLPHKLPAGHPNLTNPAICPAPKVIGEFHKRKRLYLPKSIVNISGMSYGSLSAVAIESLNRGAAKFGCYHNTGEGGLSPHHKMGSDIVLNIGTAYFGIRDHDGNFVMEKLVKLTTDNPCIRMLELKLSQGAKPGKGGVLPASKLTPELAEIRGVPMGKDVISPSYHSAFGDVVSMVDFIESMAENTGLPVGIKAAIGKTDMWETLAELMAKTGKGPDFITIDGGEGGTGAAPPAFADHVSLPFVNGFSIIYKIFQKHGLTDRVTFIASGKLGLPENAIEAFCLGADIINVARESMMSIGCIQAQICHTNRCPTGIATNDKWLQSGLDPALKSERFYNYVKTLTKELLDITHACGYEHPCQFTMEDIDLAVGENNGINSLAYSHGYQKTPVKFEGMASLVNHAHLGGNN